MKTVTPWDLKDCLSEICLIDVRNVDEYRKEFIEGAHIMPLNLISAENLSSRSAVLYCLAGIKSQKACEKLLEQDPTLDLYSLEGGLTAWKDAGFATLCSSPKLVMPLERQVQILAGSLIVISLILGFSFSPVFYSFSWAIGIGLILSGITGQCATLKILSYMPWNR